MRIKFSEIENKVLPKVGIYEIFTENEIPLKVGISNNLKKRLSQHFASKDKYLRFAEDQDRSNPRSAKSKQSILTKHLYYDRTITNEFELEKELDRQNFLLEKCYIVFNYTLSREEARKLENKIEKTKRFRYVGRVIVR